MRVVIAYDVSSGRRRRRIAAALADVGVRLQRSLVECDLEQPALEDLCRRLAAELGATDRLAVYPACAACAQRARYWGPDWSDALADL